VPPSTSGRLTLLRRAPDFRLLFLANFGSGVGTYLAAVALTVHVYDLTGSGTWVAALLVADFLPIVVIGLTLGPLVDRLSRRRLMIGSDLVRFGVFAALPFVAEPVAIVALAAVSGIATGFFRPAVYAGVPNLVDGDDELTEANSLLTGIENLAWVIGPLLAGLILAVSDADLAYWVNAATFLVSAVLVSRIPPGRLQSEESLSRGHWRDVRDGVELVVRTPQLLTVLLVWNVVIAGNAAVNVAEVIVAKTVLDGGDLGYGVIVAATGVGLMTGSLLTPVVLGSVGLRRVYVGAIALMAVGWGLASTMPTVWLAAVFAGVATVGNGCAIVCNQLLIQRGAPDAMRGRAIAVLMSSTYLTLTGAMALAGPLTNALGGRAMWAIAACVYLAGSIVAAVMVRRLRVPAVGPVPAPAAANGHLDAAPARADGELRPFDRVRALLDEVERARRTEAERSA
jgi:MFS family permease